MKNNLIFTSKLEDFYKIFLGTFLVFFLVASTNVMSSTLFVLITIYFLDGGHVYSTLLEVLGDPEEARKKYVWFVLLGSFFLNLIIHLFFNNYFFYYIFYFTIYHNMRQGLGVTFLYRIGESSALLIKRSYYFLILTPFILFHLRPPVFDGGLGEAIIKPIQLRDFFPLETLDSLYRWGQALYFFGSALIILYLLFKRNMKGFLAMLFFAVVYAYSFIFSDNQMKSYALLIFSHAIPYFFLMEKRLAVTHRVNFVKRFAWPLLFIVFFLGGLIDYYQDDVIELFEPLESIAVALLAMPLIAHFIYDAIIWKRGNERFKIFVDHSN